MFSNRELHTPGWVRTNYNHPVAAILEPKVIRKQGGLIWNAIAMGNILRSCKVVHSISFTKKKYFTSSLSSPVFVCTNWSRITILKKQYKLQKVNDKDEGMRIDKWNASFRYSNKVFHSIKTLLFCSILLSQLCYQLVSSAFIRSLGSYSSFVLHLSQVSHPSSFANPLFIYYFCFFTFLFSWFIRSFVHLVNYIISFWWILY